MLQIWGSHWRTSAPTCQTVRIWDGNLYGGEKGHICLWGTMGSAKKGSYLWNGNYISFLVLLEQITTNVMALNNTNILPYNSEGWKTEGSHWAKIRVSVWLRSSWRVQGKIYSSPFPASRGHLCSLGHDHIAPTSACVVIVLSLTLLPYSSPFETPVIQLGWPG